LPPVLGAIVGWIMLTFGTSFAVASAIVTGVITLGANFVLGAISRAIAGRPSSSIKTDLPSRSVSVRQPAAPREIVYGRPRKGGIITYASLTGASNEFFHLVYTLSGHELNAIHNLFLDGEEVPLDPTPVSGYLVPQAGNKYLGFLWVEKKLGTAGEAAFPNLISESGGLWTSNHKQEGCGSVHIKLKFSTDVFPQGVPQITFDIEGKKVFDPRSSTTAYSDNAALCIRDYLSNSYYGLGATSSELDDTANNAAANICDELVALNGGGFEPRYTCNGVATTDQQPKDILGQLLSACAGNVAYVGGTWSIWPAAWRTPTITLTDDDVRSPGTMQVRATTSKRDLCNAVKGTFIPFGQTAPTDFPPYYQSSDRGFGSDAYLTEDSGERNWTDITLPFTDSVATAQRLAKIALERARRQKSVTLNGKMSCYAAGIIEPLYLTHSRWGWSSKTFECAESRWVPYNDPEGMPILGVDLVLRESDANVYAWSTAEELASAVASTLNLPDFTACLPPTNLHLRSGMVKTSGATRTARIRVTWTAPADIFVVKIGIQYKKSADSTWSAAAEIDASLTEYLIDDVDALIAYDVRIYSINAAGAKSTYVTQTNHVVSSDPLSGVRNGDFEESATALTTNAPPGWTKVGSPTLSYETGSPYEGAQSLKIISTAGYNGSNEGVRSELIALNENDGIDISLAIVDNAYYGSGAGSALGNFKLLTGRTLAPENAVAVRLFLKPMTTGAHTVYFDVADVQVTPNVDNAADGELYLRPAKIESGEMTLANGNAELSDELPRVLNPSLGGVTGFYGPVLEFLNSGGSVIATVPLEFSTELAPGLEAYSPSGNPHSLGVAYETSSPRQGARSFKITPSQDGDGIIFREKFAVQAGEPIGIDAEVKCSTIASGVLAEVMILFFRSDDTVISGAEIIASTTGTDWVSIHAEGQAPTGVATLAYCRVAIIKRDVLGAGATIYADNVVPKRLKAVVSVTAAASRPSAWTRQVGVRHRASDTAATSVVADSSGIVNTSGTAVTRVSGDLFDTNWANDPKPTFIVNGVARAIASVTDTDHLTLASSAGTHSNVNYTVPAGQWVGQQPRLVATVGSSPYNLDLNAYRIFEITLSASVTLTKSGGAAGELYVFIITDGGGGHNVSGWPSGFSEFPDLTNVSTAYPSGLAVAQRVKVIAYYDGTNMNALSSMGG